MAALQVLVQSSPCLLNNTMDGGFRWVSFEA